GTTLAIPERDASLRLSWAAATDTGRRRTANEDSWVAKLPLFAVADGMGGHSAGDLASAAVVEHLADVARGAFVTPEGIERALDAATSDIVELATETELGVGTTVTGAALVLQDGAPYFAIFNIGDSRVYRFERNELAQVTRDHSVVQELVDAGALTAADAEHHPDSNIITRAVGFGARPPLDYWMLPPRTGMRLLVCSDGLTKEVSDARIRMHLAAGLSAVETAGALVDAALASGGRDNVTVIVIDVIEAPDDSDLEDTNPRHARH
nr:protein phosphatase 2C domain-containing protein [Actinomycetota bacterium]